MPRDHRTVRVAVVDDLLINREGTRALLRTVPGVQVEEPMDFQQALARQDWEGVDYALADVADRSRTDTETPGIEVVVHIRNCCRGRGPRIVAITGDPAAFEEDLVRRRLLEAGADHFIYRDELDRQLEQVIVDNAALEPVTAPDEIPELGLTRKTRVNELVSFLLNEGAELVSGKSWRRRDEPRLATVRAKGEAHARQLHPVNVEGGLAVLLGARHRDESPWHRRARHHG